MEPLGERLRNRARSLWRWLVPEEVELPEETRRALAALYPKLDLRRVSFHRGLPHFLHRTANGMALPGVLSARHCRIYIQPEYWRPDTVNGLGLLAHEAFHALQMQESGPGLGLVRPFIVLYLACAARNGFLYKGHPLEVDAYRVAGRRNSLFECACTARQPDSVVVPESGVAFWRRLAESAPGGVILAPFWLITWTVSTAILWLAWLLTVSLGSLAAGAMWLAGTLLGAKGVERRNEV